MWVSAGYFSYCASFDHLQCTGAGMLGTVTPDFMSLRKHWDAPELSLQSVSPQQVLGTKLIRPTAECETPQTCVPAFRTQVQHSIKIYMRSFYNSCHLLSALSILLSWKIPICFPSNHSKQCGTVLAGGLMQMHLLLRQKKR